MSEEHPQPAEHHNPVSKKTHMHRKYIPAVVAVVVAIILGVLAFTVYKSQQGSNSSNLKIAGCKGTVDVNGYSLEQALDVESQIKGLSNRDSMPQRCGMLFVFPTTEQHGIWMKDMKFNLDIMWLDQNKRIISIRENAPYNSYPEVYSPARESKYVIELNAGQARAGSFRVGQLLTFDENTPAPSNSKR